MFCFGRYSYLNQRSVRHFGLIINLINYVFVTSCTSGIKHSKLLLNTHQLSPTVFAMCSRHQRQMRDLFLMCSRYQSYLSCLFERLQQVLAMPFVRFASVLAKQIEQILEDKDSENTKKVQK